MSKTLKPLKQYNMMMIQPLYERQHHMDIHNCERCSFTESFTLHDKLPSYHILSISSINQLSPIERNQICMTPYTNPTTLVNFRIFPKKLEPFDHICFLQRKTRTQVLIELIDQYVMSVGSTVQERLDETDLINDRLKSAVRRSKDDRTRIDPASNANSAEKRLKRKLSGFDPASIDRGCNDAV